jgi:hypothetical protein
MRGLRFSPGHDRRLLGDWLPLVGEVVCVHPDQSAEHAYLARVLAFQDNEYDSYRRYRVQPLFAPRTNARDIHRIALEPTMATFQGYVCLTCRKGRIR